MKKLLTGIVLFLFVQKSFTQSNDYTDAFRLINSWIEAQRDYSDIPSISVAIVKDQQTIWSKAYGMANNDSKLQLPPIQFTAFVLYPNSLLRLPSCNCMMPANSALMIYIETILPHYTLKQQYKESGPVYPSLPVNAFFRFATRIRLSILDKPGFSIPFTSAIEL
ncbi:MAG: hypothetical protein WDO71_16880 [Bacteroidota bacterium]